MPKFHDILLQEIYNELIDLGYDPDFAYEMVMELETDLSSRNTMDFEEVLNVIDRMLEEDATHSG